MVEIQAYQCSDIISYLLKLAWQLLWQLTAPIRYEFWSCDGNSLHIDHHSFVYIPLCLRAKPQTWQHQLFLLILFIICQSSYPYTKPLKHYSAPVSQPVSILFVIVSILFVIISITPKPLRVHPRFRYHKQVSSSFCDMKNRGKLLKLQKLDLVFISFSFSFLLIYFFIWELGLGVRMMSPTVTQCCYSHTVTWSCIMIQNSRRFWKKWCHIIYYIYIAL